MAFITIGLVQISSIFAPYSSNSEERLTLWQYTSSTDTVADMLVLNYFLEPAQAENGLLRNRDLLLLKDTTTYKVVLGQICKIDESNVEIKLSMPFGATDSFVGAAAQTAFTIAIPGAAVGDIVVASIRSLNTPPATIQSAIVNVANTVTITLEAAYTGDIAFDIIIQNNSA